MNPTMKKSKYVLFALAALAVLFPLATTYYGHTYDLPGVGMDRSDVFMMIDPIAVASIQGIADGFMQTGIAWSAL